ncbi:MAG TPA: PPOX class F420-dependent oxidoreductase [Anaerolineales bacterium]|nr:PPOX class F420-dependent oxidoreductase [Anaerolineales bacterium]
MTALQISEKYYAWLKSRAFAHLATLMPDGSPQVTPVWIDTDGEMILVNTARGRQKDLNMQRDGRVALSIMNPDNPYDYVQVRGLVVLSTENGAREHIDELSQRYLGHAYQANDPDQVRVIYQIRPLNLLDE